MKVTWNVVSRVLTIVALLARPAIAVAQDATISGTVTDGAGKPLAGVMITATHVESGQTVTAVSDANGAYRVPVRVGADCVFLHEDGSGTEPSRTVREPSTGAHFGSAGLPRISASG